MSAHFAGTARNIKGALPLATYAATLTELRSVGRRLRGCCPLPDHEDKTPSFDVYADTDSFYCHGCHRGGDIIELCYLAENCQDRWEALAWLAWRHDIDLGERTVSWKEAQARKVSLIDSAYEVVGHVYCRRTYATLIYPYVKIIDDPEIRHVEIERTWRDWQHHRSPGIWSDLVAGVLSGDQALIIMLARLYLQARPEYFDHIDTTPLREQTA